VCLDENDTEIKRNKDGGCVSVDEIEIAIKIKWRAVLLRCYEGGWV